MQMPPELVIDSWTMLNILGTPILPQGSSPRLAGLRFPPGFEFANNLSQRRAGDLGLWSGAMTWRTMSVLMAHGERGAEATRRCSESKCGLLPCLLDQDEAILSIILAAVVVVAALSAGAAAAELAHPLRDGPTVRTGIDVVLFHLPAWQRQCVAGGLAGDAEIGTGELPLTTMRLDAAAPRAMVGD